MPALSSMTGMYAERVHHSPSQHSPAAAAEYEGVQRPTRPHELFRRYVRVLHVQYPGALPCFLRPICTLTDAQHTLELRHRTPCCSHRPDPPSPARLAHEERRKALQAQIHEAEAELMMLDMQPVPASPHSLTTSPQYRSPHLAPAVSPMMGATLAPDALSLDTQLQLLFLYFCKYGRTGGKGDQEDTMDNFMFSKSIKDSPGLMGCMITSAEVDLTFAKCKAKQSRRLTYSQWLHALACLAGIKYPDMVLEVALEQLCTRHLLASAPAQAIRALAESGELEIQHIKPSPGKPGAVRSIGGLNMHAAVAAAAAASPSATPSMGTATVLRPPPPATTHSRPTSPARHDAVGSQWTGTASPVRHAVHRYEQSAPVGFLAQQVREMAGHDMSASVHCTRPRRGSVREPVQYGSPEYRPTLAGEANAPSSVFARLSSPAHFTGVYRRAWMTDGRMNAFSDTGVSARPTRYAGNTNTNTNEVIHSVGSVLRPSLHHGLNMKV